MSKKYSFLLLAGMLSLTGCQSKVEVPSATVIESDTNEEENDDNRLDIIRDNSIDYVKDNTLCVASFADLEYPLSMLIAMNDSELISNESLTTLKIVLCDKLEQYMEENSEGNIISYGNYITGYYNKVDNVIVLSLTNIYDYVLSNIDINNDNLEIYYEKYLLATFMDALNYLSTNNITLSKR